MKQHSPSSTLQGTGVSPNRASRWPWGLLIVLTLTVFGLVVLTITLSLRKDVRERIVSRDGEIFTAVAQMLLNNNGQIESLRFVDVFTTVLQMSRMQGVLAVRVYDNQGNFLDSVPLEVEPTPLPAELLERMANLTPASSFESEGDLGEIFLLFPDTDVPVTTPLLHVAIPIHQPGSDRLDSIAYYTVDGRHIAEEFKALDRSLVFQAGVAFTTGSLIFLIASGIAFHRLNRANRLLQKRTQSLLKANQELALAAKSSAVGAVSAHLVHGLKSPLAGLNDFVRTSKEQSAPSSADDWQAARETTERMRNLIESVTNILREERDGAAFEVSLAELVGLVRTRMVHDFDTVQVAYDLSGDSEDAIFLSSREANLITLILVNLLENAYKANPAGKPVLLSIKQPPNALVFEVRDHGSGIAAPVRENLFQPGAGGFSQGTGLGLAISHQLALHLGADLELVETGPTGSLFRLEIPPPGETPAEG
jgi:signal transduction histidine kinase